MGTFSGVGAQLHQPVPGCTSGTTGRWDSAFPSEAGPWDSLQGPPTHHPEGGGGALGQLECLTSQGYPLWFVPPLGTLGGDPPGFTLKLGHPTKQET